MFQCSTPLNVQFEVTYRCNNHCVFCYNNIPVVNEKEINTELAMTVIRNIKDNGILSLNFNGGEPLIRSDFFDLAAYAKSLDLDIHLNTNANLVDDECAKKISALFPAVCTTILSADNTVHDRLSGRVGVLQDTLNGIRHLKEHKVYVAVNLMLCELNADNIETTLDIIRENRIKTLLVTRYVPTNGSNDELHISDERFFYAIRRLSDYQKRHGCFDRIALPQPVKLCTAADDIADIAGEWNIPCNIGLCTASIDAFGNVKPCNLVERPILGNAVKNSFSDIWERFDGESYCRNEHLTARCLSCDFLNRCGGGCKGFQSALYCK